MKKYVFLNPVVCNLYDMNYLKFVLNSHNFEVVFSLKDNADIVRKNYDNKCLNSNKCIIDSRCPKIKNYITKDCENANINPILIETALELHSRKNSEEDILFITTPCIALKDLGNELKLKNTIFIAWSDFLRENNIILDSSKKLNLIKSPIPLGFFDELKKAYNIVSISGEKEIIDFFRNNLYKDNKLVEALYCKNGCHNGDGL